MVRIRWQEIGVACAVVVAACAPGSGGEAATAADGGDDQERTAAVAGATGAAGERAPSQQPPSQHAWVIFGADTVVAEMAVSADERAEGLMYREELPDGTGMLFVFPDQAIRSFWMQNTYIDLDLAYMDASYTIVDLHNREALDATSVPSAAPAMYVLEVRGGWFAEHDIGVGSQAHVVYGTQVGR